MTAWLSSHFKGERILYALSFQFEALSSAQVTTKRLICVTANIFFKHFLTVRNQLLRMLTFHIQETTGMYRMLVGCIFAIVTMPAFVTMDTVGSTVNITGFVGETIELRCFNPSANDEFTWKTRAVSWMYLFQDDCFDNPSYVTVGRCAEGSWEYLSYSHQLVGNDDSCGNGLAYIRSQEPGNFTYKCHKMSGDGIDVILEVIFHYFHRIQFINITVPCEICASITKPDL